MLGVTKTLKDTYKNLNQIPCMHLFPNQICYFVFVFNNVCVCFLIDNLYFIYLSVLNFKKNVTFPVISLVKLKRRKGSLLDFSKNFSRGHIWQIVNNPSFLTRHRENVNTLPRIHYIISTPGLLVVI